MAEGSFAAAAARLNRTHPTVHAAVTALEAQVGMVLLDRAGYRVSLTVEGAAFRSRVAVFLHQYENLRREAAQLAAGKRPSCVWSWVTCLHCRRDWVR